MLNIFVYLNLCIVQMGSLICDFVTMQSFYNNMFVVHRVHINHFTVKSVFSGHSKIDKTKILMTNDSLMKIESIAEWSILQYF